MFACLTLQKREQADWYASVPHPVKVYDRPAERKPLPYILALVAVVVLLAAGVFIYRSMNHPAAVHKNPSTGMQVPSTTPSPLLSEVSLHSKNITDFCPQNIVT